MLPSEARERKQVPVATGLIDYFPDALAEVAHVSFVGNEQHNPGTALHWDRSKSGDEADALMRHFLERGGLDDDGQRHSAKVAWRALAMLQKELEGAHGEVAVEISREAREKAEWCYGLAGRVLAGRVDPHVASLGTDTCCACGISREQAAVLGHEFRG